MAVYKNELERIQEDREFMAAGDVRFAKMSGVINDIPCLERL